VIVEYPRAEPTGATTLAVCSAFSKEKPPLEGFWRTIEEMEIREKGREGNATYIAFLVLDAGIGNLR